MFTRSSRRHRRQIASVGLAAAITAGLITALAPPSGAAALPVTAAVDLGRIAATTDPFAIGVGSSTYGATPLSSPVQAAAEKSLDARTVRIPVGYRNGRVTSSAAGTGGTLDAAALVRTYRSWGYRALIVIGGRTNDVDVQPGDATKIMQAIGFEQVSYTAPNEPGNHGKSMTDQTALATMITQEGRALRPDFRLTGPAWAYYDRGALTAFATAMGARLGGLDYHHYAMGTTSLSTARALSETAAYGTEVGTLRQDLRARGLDVPVTVDELNFSWRYRDGTPGGNNRFFTAVNTVWMTSALGHILKAGGRALPYATQNGPLGVMVQAGQVNPDNRAASSPMPAYWGIANWTGGQRWPHFKDTVYESSTTDPTVEAFAVNNEAGGYNVLLINKSETDARDLTVRMTGAGAGRYTAYRNDPAAPYDPPAAVGSSSFAANPALSLALPAMTVTVLVVTPQGSSGSTPTPTTPPSASPTALPTTAPPTTAPTTTARTTTTPASTTAVSTTAVGPPSAPTGLSVTRSADGTRATVTWSAPAGNAAISGFRIARDGADSTGGGAYATTLAASARTFTFTLLRPDATYRFSVQATNGAGPGATAVIGSAPATTAPVSVGAAGPGDPTRVTVSWQPPAAAGGLPVTGYRVTRDGSDSTGGGAYSTVRAADARAFTFTLLKRATTYTFTVAAVTANGPGPAATVRFTTG